MVRRACFLASALAILFGRIEFGIASEPKALTERQPPATPQTIDRWWLSMTGEIRGVPKGDGSKIECSEVLDVGRPVSIRSLEIYRKVYVVNVARKAFADAAPVVRYPQISSQWSSRPRILDGKGEMILDTWECAFPPTKDVYVVVSLAILKLSDGREVVCRFRPLFVANGSVLSRNEEMAEEMAEKRRLRKRSRIVDLALGASGALYRPVAQAWGDQYPHVVGFRLPSGLG